MWSYGCLSWLQRMTLLLARVWWIEFGLTVLE